MKLTSLLLAFFLPLPGVLPLVAAEPAVFSGPQPGERATPFKVAELKGEARGTEREMNPASLGGPWVLVFVHGLERSMLPLMLVVDEYSAARGRALQSEFVFLSADRLEGLQRFPRALQSIQLKSAASLSLDGAEGPGNYGLNKQCLLTILVGKGENVTENFALVQPGIADGDRVVRALAKVSGDANPPDATRLVEERRERRMARQGKDMKKTGERGMRPPGPEKKDPFPGAVPTDPTLSGLLRQVIRKDNDDATVDRLVAEMRKQAGHDAGLRKQLADGWTRVLHFDDRYGTEYARRQGRGLMVEMQTSP